MGLMLNLSLGEAMLLRDHLSRHIAALDDDLVHTEKRELQHELAAEVDRLRAVAAKLSELVLSLREEP